MKKIILWILLCLLLGITAVAYASWNYDAITSGTIADTDELLLLDVSDETAGVNGTMKRLTMTVLVEWLGLKFPISKSFNFNGPSTADDFIIYRAKRALTVTSIEGIIEGSGDITGTFQECDSAGASCVDIEADITFDGGLDTDAGGIDAPNIESGNTIKWVTDTVTTTEKLWAQINFN